MNIRVGLFVIVLATAVVGANAAQLSAFDYGVACRGAVELTGMTSIRRANSASEANALSASGTCPAFTLMSNSVIQGDVYAQGPDAKCGSDQAGELE